MERTETQRAGGRSKRKSRKAIAAKAEPAEAVPPIVTPHVMTLFEDFANRSSEFSREII